MFSQEQEISATIYLDDADQCYNIDGITLILKKIDDTTWRYADKSTTINVAYLKDNKYEIDLLLYGGIYHTYAELSNNQLISQPSILKDHNYCGNNQSSKILVICKPLTQFDDISKFKSYDFIVAQAKADCCLPQTLTIRYLENFPSNNVYNCGQLTMQGECYYSGSSGGMTFMYSTALMAPGAPNTASTLQVTFSCGYAAGQTYSNSATATCNPPNGAIISFGIPGACVGQSGVYSMSGWFQMTV